MLNITRRVTCKTFCMMEAIGFRADCGFAVKVFVRATGPLFVVRTWVQRPL